MTDIFDYLDNEVALWHGKNNGEYPYKMVLNSKVWNELQEGIKSRIGFSDSWATYEIKNYRGILIIIDETVEGVECYGEITNEEQVKEVI